MASDSAPNNPKKYYDVLGLSNRASACAIRNAFKRLAMQWHPDKCSGHDLSEAKAKFQEIQEAYAVLSDERKKMLSDSGIYSPSDNEEDIQGLGNFINEILDMMSAQTSEEPGKESTFQELQELFVNMFGADLAAMGNACAIPTASKIEKKRCWAEGHKQKAQYIFLEHCQLIADNSIALGLFDEAIYCDSKLGSNASKKPKTTISTYETNGKVNTQ